MSGNTKERILEVALDMFSQYGYAGTNLREIAAELGITKAALYKHYKSKEDIWNSTMDVFDDYYKKNALKSGKEMKIPSTLEEFKTQEKTVIKVIMTNPMIRKGRRLLTIEQFRDEKTAATATNRFITTNVERLKLIFAPMIKNGLLIDTDIDMLALAYTTPISALIQMCDREPRKQELTLKMAEEFVDYFISIYGIKRT